MVFPVKVFFWGGKFSFWQFPDPVLWHSHEAPPHAIIPEGSQPSTKLCYPLESKSENAKLYSRRMVRIPVS